MKLIDLHEDQRKHFTCHRCKVRRSVECTGVNQYGDPTSRIPLCPRCGREMDDD